MSGLWQMVDEQPRIGIAALTSSDVPESPGVYAIYREDRAIYVGKAANLRKRIWGAHCGQNKSMRNSAFRRNVAQHLSIAPAADIYRQRYRLSTEELARVRSFVEDCQVSWMKAETETMAVSVETQLKLEWKPPLTKI